MTSVFIVKCNVRLIPPWLPAASVTYNSAMALQELLTDLRRDHAFMENVAAWRTLPARRARLEPIPDSLHPLLRAGLVKRGIAQLYSHQAEALEHAQRGESLVVITPTASGKTLTYQLPVLNMLLRDDAARALYLFPTKALAQDQLAGLRSWANDLSTEGVSLRPATYDGDTPSSERSRVRAEARIILSNPDMLHVGILPSHAQWARFFAGLRYVVLDELHTYRGVFGSHVANILRRLQRICAFYGSAPHFICTSATIANPRELAQAMVEQPVRLIDQNGAPRGEKQIVLYNPPMYDAELGLRKSAILESQGIAARTLQRGVQTIVFGKTRLATELLLTYMRDTLARSRDFAGNVQSAVRGYRGGYLPEERREIERGLREGDVRAVTATNALELGIDIGQLQAAVLCGYPGTIASAWQQMGRAGRTLEGALAVLVATGLPIDQYLMQHPDFLFERSPEQALVNPDNLMLLVDQMRCAAFELPFRAGEGFGNSPFAADVLDHLREQGELQLHQGRYLWAGEASPARQINIRAAGNDPVQVQAQDSVGSGGVRIIGAVDDWRAPMQVHKGAVYLHEGATWLIDELSLEDRTASARRAEVDFYTQADIETELDVLAEHDRRETPAATVCNGEVRVTTQVVSFRRIRRFTHEQLGAEPLDFSPSELDTTGYWFTVTPAAQRRLEEQGAWFDSLNDYGPNWNAMRLQVRVRDKFRCTQCGAPESPGREHDVHHLTPFRTFGYVRGVNDFYLLANRIENLVLVCRTCHRRLEAAVRTRSALQGLGYALHNLAPLYLMCDPEDLGLHVSRAEIAHKSPPKTATVPASTLEGELGEILLRAEQAPTPLVETGPIHEVDSVSENEKALAGVTLYENVAAGLGFHLRLFELHDTLLRAARERILDCPCEHGCPACVGPVVEAELLDNSPMNAKRITLLLIDELLVSA